MLKIYITRQSRYPADTRSLKKRLRGILSLKGVRDAEVSLALVGERKMVELSRKYLKEESGVHEVLSFPYENFFSPPDGHSRLGDIVICYPEARKIAMKKRRMVDDVLGELAEHGMLHLLGEHHGG